MVDIYPNEPITYSKATQTMFSNDWAANHSPTNEYEDNFSHQKAKPSKRMRKEKPLAYYDDIFVYDTLQWEDEFNNPSDSAVDHLDLNKHLNLESLSLIESQLNSNKINSRNEIISCLGLIKILIRLAVSRVKRRTLILNKM